MSEHVLKTIEPYFTAVKEGRKTFEARRNDRGYQTGDTLVLLDPSTGHDGCSDSCDDRLRGAIRKSVSYVFAGDPQLRDLGGLVPGYVVLGLGEAEMPYCAECGCSTPNGAHFLHCRTQAAATSDSHEGESK